MILKKNVSTIILNYTENSIGALMCGTIFASLLRCYYLRLRFFEEVYCLELTFFMLILYIGQSIIVTVIYFCCHSYRETWSQVNLHFNWHSPRHYFIHDSVLIVAFLDLGQILLDVDRILLSNMYEFMSFLISLVSFSFCSLGFF